MQSQPAKSTKLGLTSRPLFFTMKILKIIHGYPPHYTAGSEVYSQTLCLGLAERHEVHVFTREEDVFAPDFRLRQAHDLDDPRITLHIVNNPRYKDRYRAAGIDQRFAEVLKRVNPDIVHVGHLNHLSTSLLHEVAMRRLPIIFTLHDYWLMCPRGQFMQMFPGNPENLWEVCARQEDRKCAERCYARYFSGAPDWIEADIKYWTNWVARRMKHLRETTELVDLFISPSQYLKNRFINDFGLPASKVVYLDYGFSNQHLRGRCRGKEDFYTFGYIGTHIPAKGMHDLIQAFGKLSGNARLRIWGHPRGQNTTTLKNMARVLPASVADRVEWCGGYENKNIVRAVFNHCDAIIVPSVWVENSPLVIHEAQQVRIPVITANVGGMSEYVRHEVNGLLFEHRSIESLAMQMQRLADNPALATSLGARGYLHDESGNIPDIHKHVREMEGFYERAKYRCSNTQVFRASGPWRITFDTNPDHCNMHCVMCEEHSGHSLLQIRRKAEGRRPRLMPFELIERVVADAAPHGLREIIPSTMGEPLLYEHFENILALCHRYGVKLNLTTNGTFPRLGARLWAKRIVPLASDVKISWNGATKATYEMVMRGGCWVKALDNVRDFVSVRNAIAEAGGNRCRITFQLTFMESNVAELPDMVRLAATLGVDRVKGHHLWVHFPQLEHESLLRNADSIARWNDAVKAAHAAAHAGREKDGSSVLLENIFPLDATAVGNLATEGRCPFLGQEAWVSTEGRFDPCCAPDAQRRNLGEFGNLKEQRFMEIWNGNAYAELIATYHNRRLCCGCHMRKLHKGDSKGAK